MFEITTLVTEKVSLCISQVCSNPQQKRKSDVSNLLLYTWSTVLTLACSSHQSRCLPISPLPQASQPNSKCAHLHLHMGAASYQLCMALHLYATCRHRCYRMPVAMQCAAALGQPVHMRMRLTCKSPRSCTLLSPSSSCGHASASCWCLLPAAPWCAFSTLPPFIHTGAAVPLL